MNEDIDLGHEDNEPHMIKGDLYRIGKYAMELYAIVEELEETGQEIDFPAWWQAMITDSKEKMVKSKHYLDFELKEPAIDAAVDALTGERPHMGEPEAPMMEDMFSGRNDMSSSEYGGRDNMRIDYLAAKIAKALKDPKNQDAEDQNNIKQARKAMNDDYIKAAEKLIKPYLSEKIAKKLTKDELKEMIKNSINEGDIDEGFFDRLKSNIKGITAKTSTTFDNLKAFAKGDKDAIKDPKLAQNIAKLQQKAKTLDSELASVMKDISILFPEDVIAQTPEQFQSILMQYTVVLDSIKRYNAKISKGELGNITTPTKTTSSSTPSPKPTGAPTTAAAPTSPKPTGAPTKAAAPTSPKPTGAPTKAEPSTGKARDEKGRFTSTKTTSTTSKSTSSAKAEPISDKYEVTKDVYNFNGKDFAVQVDKDTKGKFFKNDDGRVMDISTLEKSNQSVKKPKSKVAEDLSEKIAKLLKSK